MKMFSPVVRAIFVIVGIALIILCVLILLGVITNKWIQVVCYFVAAVMMVIVLVEAKKR